MAGLCLLKPEPHGEFGLAGPLQKLSTFKIADTFSGQKYGELLLKAVFDRCAAEEYVGIYMTAFERHTELLAVLAQFGFERLVARTSLGEPVLHKPLRWTIADLADSDALGFHIRFGPPALSLKGTHPHIIPIEPRWHRMLFPDAEPAHQDSETLFPATDALETHPFGNALRKAYLCRASTRHLRPGDPLLFYRSRDEKAVLVIGVCESVTRSTDANEIATLVGKRTVYTFDQIEEQALGGEVLVVLFRQARVLRSDPMTLEELQSEGAVSAWPQTIQRVREEGIPWLRQRLAA